ncbi:hypothetical protein HUU59_02925 [bacterium]|nr:hypothetical protein [bacterium]
MSSKTLVLTQLLAMVMLLASCDDDEGDSHQSQTAWHAELLVPGGFHPVLSPNGDAFLFTGIDGSLNLWRSGQEHRVTDSGVVVRADYTWSVSDDGYFAYSVPGAPGDGSVTVASLAGESFSVWDRGSNPYLNVNEGYLLCAEPQGDSTENGVWKFNLSDLSRVRLSANALSCRAFSNGQLFAFLEPKPHSSGLSLQVQIAESDSIILTIDHVAGIDCRFHLSALGLEVVTNPDDVLNTTAIYRVDPTQSAQLQFIANPATDVIVLQDGSLIYNRITSNQLGPLVLCVNGNETVVSDSLYDASANSKQLVLATGQLGIYRLIFD